MAFTAPWVPTGMNTGVSTVPWAVAMTPRRARPSVWVTRKENAGGVIGRYSLQFDLETQRTTKGTERTTEKCTEDTQRFGPWPSSVLYPLCPLYTLCPLCFEMKKLRVGIIYGGRSGEHEISLASAAAVFENLDPERYEPVAIRIEKDGRWMLPDRPPELASAADVIAASAGVIAANAE